MRSMSFSLTTEQFYNRSKTVTRRLGWANLRPGDLFCGVVKGQGIRKGEHVQRIHVAKCVSNRPEPLGLMMHSPSYGAVETILEGFPKMTAFAFVDMFCQHNGCKSWTTVQRIEFSHCSNTESEFLIVLEAVKKIFPNCVEHDWFELVDRICSSPRLGERCDFCQCCGNDCCNSRKCQQAIKSRPILFKPATVQKALRPQKAAAGLSTKSLPYSIFPKCHGL